MGILFLRVIALLRFGSLLLRLDAVGKLLLRCGYFCLDLGLCCLAGTRWVAFARTHSGPRHNHVLWDGYSSKGNVENGLSDAFGVLDLIMH